MRLLDRPAFALLAISAVALGLTRSAAAQLDVSVLTVGRVNVSSTLRGVTRSATIPAPRNVTPSMDAYVSHNASDYARSRSTLNAAADRFHWQFLNTASAMSLDSYALAEGTLRLRAAWNGTGALVARLRVTVEVNDADSFGWVDVGDDGTWDAGIRFLYHRPTYEQVVQIDSRGLYIRAGAHTSAARLPRSLLEGQRHDANITVELEPVRIVEVGVACGPQLRGSLRAGGSHGLLDLYVTGSPPGTWGLFYIGATPMNYPLSPTGCRLYVYPDTYAVVPVSAAGTVQVLGTRLPAVLGVGAYFQYLAQDVSTPETDWYTSQALFVTAF